jgi:hypothetical protein
MSENKNNAMYLELLKAVLTNKVYGRFEYMDLFKSDGRARRWLGYFFLLQLRLIGMLFPKYKQFVTGRVLLSRECDWKARNNGNDWPPYAYTMIGSMRLDNLHKALDTITNNNVPGDIIETGVWRGGACIFANGYLKVNGIKNRKVWALDSFEGLPEPDEVNYPLDKGDIHHLMTSLEVSLETVKKNFESLDLLDDNVIFVKGYFSDTVPTLKIGPIAILRLDGDMYESTIVVLNHLYPKLSDGGIIIIDDWGLPNCRKAVEDYRAQHNITERIIDIDGVGVYWIAKTSQSKVAA